MGPPRANFGKKFAGLSALKTPPTLGRELLLRLPGGGVGSRDGSRDACGVPGLAATDAGGNEPSLPEGGSDGGRP